MTLMEVLPDELLIQICIYLKPYDVLNSLNNLNTRLNRTITKYRQNINLSNISFDECQRYCTLILPSISSTIRSLTLSNRHTPKQIEIVLNKLNFKYQFECLTLIDCTNDDTERYLTKLEIFQHLNEFHILSDNLLLENETFVLKKLFSNKTHLNKIDIKWLLGFSLEHIVLKQNKYILDLEITLNSINDLMILFNIVPNIQRLNVEIGSDSCVSKIKSLNLCSLTYLHLKMDNRQLKYYTFELLMRYIPTLEHVSINISTYDKRFINGHDLKSLLHKLKQFHCSVELKDKEINIDYVIQTFTTEFWLIEKKWYINCYNDFDCQTFYLHTLPYPYKIMSSIHLVNSKSTSPTIIYSTITDVFFNGHNNYLFRSSFFQFLNQFRNIQRLTLSQSCFIMDKQQQPLVLSKLRHLSILGSFDNDLSLIFFNSLLSKCLNISSLCLSYIKIQLLIQNINSDYYRWTNYIEHLTIHSSNEITLDELQTLSKIFPKINYLKFSILNDLFNKSICITIDNFRYLKYLNVYCVKNERHNIEILLRQNTARLKNKKNKFVCVYSEDEQNVEIWI
ncbi:unnamed protein product [Didymodactylos carnosus]|uniref:F-box domain-containing protein n=1 Tax=Didymodactylos carnosus TaxID=1234261 RepID=A0A814UFT2_9BILA|nr:unnamed protein product [Didymodactylos carnosus]CAF1174291.1 unnamed protein product [Didymodactylos carnosus]CAF3695741.1 unnamed protein product [Didymodactylos carnosus]CAF3938177.1 unnamed protein product [Didymodactylos carnosus]